MQFSLDTQLHLAGSRPATGLTPADELCLPALTYAVTADRRNHAVAGGPNPARVLARRPMR